MADLYRYQLGRAAVFSAVLVRLLEVDPVLPRAVRHIARLAHALLDKIVMAEEEACVGAERRGRAAGSFDISCAGCFGTAPQHRCHLLHVDAVRVALEALNGPEPTSLVAIADLIRKPLIAAYRRRPSCELAWQRWGDGGFEDTVRFVARGIGDELVDGAPSVREAARRWMATEEEHERRSHRIGRLSPWAYHLLLEAWTSTMTVCALFDQEDALLPSRNSTGLEDASRARRVLLAMPHEAEALLARRQYAGGEKQIRVSAGAADAAVMAIGWDGGRVVARGAGPYRELCPAERNGG
jgi:hypothetical protein